MRRLVVAAACATTLLLAPAAAAQVTTTTSTVRSGTRTTSVDREVTIVLVSGAVIFVGFVAVFLVGRRRLRE